MLKARLVKLWCSFSKQLKATIMHYKTCSRKLQLCNIIVGSITYSFSKICTSFSLHDLVLFIYIHAFVFS